MGKMYEALQKVEREKILEQKEDSPKADVQDLVMHDKLISYFEPTSMAAEQFRRLRTYIIKPGTTDSPRTILVTSAMAGEGKSLIAKANTLLQKFGRK